MPGYLEKNRATLSSSERARYEQQLVIIRQICSQYEREDTGESVRNTRVITLLQQVREVVSFT